MYNRTEAVEYALRHGKRPNPRYHYFPIYGQIGGDCTNFVSQCLHAGGIPKVRNSHAPWWYEDQYHWSIAWVHAHSLYWCLKIRERKQLNGPRGIEVENLEQLELGDLIFYENIKGGIDHVAIITAFYDGLPIITQHSPELINIPYIKTNKGKMHFMKITS